MTEKQIRRYCHVVGSYLPCSGRQKREILRGLHQRIVDCCAESPNNTAEMEKFFGSPQQVAAAYVEDMNTTELLVALRIRRKILTIISIGVLSVLIIFAIVLCAQLHEYHQTIGGWADRTITLFN